MKNHFNIFSVFFNKHVNDQINKDPSLALQIFVDIPWILNDSYYKNQRCHLDHYSIWDNGKIQKRDNSNLHWIVSIWLENHSLKVQGHSCSLYSLFHRFFLKDRKKWTLYCLWPLCSRSWSFNANWEIKMSTWRAQKSPHGRYYRGFQELP